MNFILKKLNNPQQNKLCKVLWTIVSLIYLVMLASFFILPFLGRIRATNIAFTVLWYISCALLIELIIEKPLREKNYKGLINIAYLSPLILFFALVFVGKYYEIKQLTVLYSFYWALLCFLALIVLGIFLRAGKETSKHITEKPPLNKKISTMYLILLLTIIAFVLSIVFNTKVQLYIFGIILSLTFMMVALSNYQKWTGKNVALIVKTATFIDFLLGLGIMIYLIYIIQDKVLQNVILIIISAITGGLLTLLGVAWTIKRQDEIRKEDAIKQAKPYFVIDGLYSNIVIQDFMISNQDVEDKPFFYGISTNGFHIHNSNNADAIIIGCTINDNFYPCNPRFFKRDDVIQIWLTGNQRMHFTNKIENIAVIAKDLLDNQYQYACTFEEISHGSAKIEKNNGDIQDEFDYTYQVFDIALPKEYKEQL